MLSAETINCIDVNSRYCPCLLADTNHCILCSHLQGGDTCDCHWHGVCIFYEKYWQPAISPNSNSQSITRAEFETEFTVLDAISANTFLIEFAVNYELAELLKRTGSFVFLKRPSDFDGCFFPVGIMKVEGERLQVVIETVGPKSSRLFVNNNKNLLVRGPYFNGVFGQPWIDNLTCGKIILIAGGIGQAPALPLAQKLISNNNELSAILAPGKVGKVFISEQLEKLGSQVYSVSTLRKEGLPLFEKLIGEYQPDLIVSAGPDEQHYSIITLMHHNGVNIPMTATNNAIMCCGEGMCGSCEKKTKDNKMVKTCKTQVEFSRFI